MYDFMELVFNKKGNVYFPVFSFYQPWQVFNLQGFRVIQVILRFVVVRVFRKQGSPF